VEALLELRADVDAVTSYGWTPLHYAAERGHVASVQALCRGVADIDARNIRGRTALRLASLKGHVGVVEALLERGADFESRSAIVFSSLHSRMHLSPLTLPFLSLSLTFAFSMPQ
jgi:ankyrin repeat protein